jgi:hypothetical protein
MEEEALHPDVSNRMETHPGFVASSFGHLGRAATRQNGCLKRQKRGRGKRGKRKHRMGGQGSARSANDEQKARASSKRHESKATLRGRPAPIAVKGEARRVYRGRAKQTKRRRASTAATIVGDDDDGEGWAWVR